MTLNNFFWEELKTLQYVFRIHGEKKRRIKKGKKLTFNRRINRKMRNWNKNLDLLSERSCDQARGHVITHLL